eukprot:gene24460-10465_t
MPKSSPYMLCEDAISLDNFSDVRGIGECEIFNLTNRMLNGREFGTKPREPTLGHLIPQTPLTALSPVSTTDWDQNESSQ